MSWLKLDDGFFEHPKIIGLSDGALALHACSLGYAARNSTDGFIPTAAVKALRGNERRAAELVAARVWHLGGGSTLACGKCERLLDRDVWQANGWVIHDFLEYNPSAAEQARKRDAARQRMADVRTGRSAPAQTSSLFDAAPDRSPDVRANNSDVRENISHVR